MQKAQFFLTCCVVAALFRTSAQAAEIDRISAYQGTWKTHIVHMKTRLSAASTDDSTLKSVCLHSAGYFACQQIVNGKVEALLVFTYDEKTKTYTSRAFPAAPTAAMTEGSLIISGNTWTYPWRETINGNALHARVVNTFTDANTIAFRQEYSLDNVHWTVTATGIEHRIAP